MTAQERVSAWLRARTPVPPRQLAARIDTLTVEIADREVSADAFLGAAEVAMATLLSGGCLTRESALELLAIDALVTYAFEIAADAPEQLESRAANALARISALSEPYDA